MSDLDWRLDEILDELNLNRELTKEWDTAKTELEALLLSNQEQIYNLVSKHFPNDKNFQAFYKEFAEIRREME